MFITDLPVETISQILSNVSNRDDMYECARVCKTWRKQMVPVYYRDITVQRNHEQYLLKVQTQITGDDHRIGDFVNTLTFGDKVESLLSQENFELLINTTSSLRALRFSQSSIDQTLLYLQYLQKMPLCTHLEEVSIVGYFFYDDFIYYENICRVYHSVTYQPGWSRITTDFFLIWKSITTIDNYQSHFRHLSRKEVTWFLLIDMFGNRNQSTIMECYNIYKKSTYCVVKVTFVYADVAEIYYEVNICFLCFLNK